MEGCRWEWAAVPHFASLGTPLVQAFRQMPWREARVWGCCVRQRLSRSDEPENGEQNDKSKGEQPHKISSPVSAALESALIGFQFREIDVGDGGIEGEAFPIGRTAFHRQIKDRGGASERLLQHGRDVVSANEGALPPREIQLR